MLSHLAEVDQVIFDENDSKRALVVVPDNKLSLAIGRRGQNVRLAAHLTGYRIDIKSASEFEAMEEAASVDLEVENGYCRRIKVARGGKDENEKNPFAQVCCVQRSD